MGGSSHAENSAIVAEQKKQADDAAAKETKRQKNIDTGLAGIRAAFHGTPVTKATTHAFNWKGFNDKTALPKGYTRVQIDPVTGKATTGTPAQAATTGGITPMAHAGDPGYGGSTGTASLTPGKAAVAAVPAGAPATGGVTAIMGPDGKIYKSGQAFNYTSNDPTGVVKGGPQPILDKFRNTYTSYYTDQVNQQKAKADQEAAFRLARAGLGVSSAATNLQADLSGQNLDKLAEVGNSADAATHALSDKFGDEEDKARTLLYQTENPTLAANKALSDVRNLSLETPTLSPLSQIFDIAAVGGANILKNYNNQKAYNQFDMSLPGGSGSSTIHN